MNNKVTCKQIQAILPFYLKGKTNPVMSQIIEDHLATCEICKDYYLKALEEYNDFLYPDCAPDNEITVGDDEKFITKEYASFKKKLSAYLDSELEDRENIKIKKMTIANPLARKDLEDMYLFKRLLHTSFERTKENCKYDFSKIIMKKLNNQTFYNPNYIYKIGFMILSLFIVLLISLIV